MDKKKKAEFIIGFAVGSCVIGAVALVMLTIFWLVL